jgi:beta-ketodecanoyl-[acyl-carrier-protein] synthase
MVISAEPNPGMAESFRVVGTAACSTDVLQQYPQQLRLSEPRRRAQASASRDKLFVQEGRKVFKEVCPGRRGRTNQRPAGNDLWDMASRGIREAPVAASGQPEHEPVLIARRVLGREASPEEAPVILDRVRNTTSSAGSVIAFHKHHAGFADPGSCGVLCSFGAGYSIGSVVLERC